MDQHDNKSAQLDGCEFFILADSVVSGLMLCIHKSTELKPISFVLIACPNDYGYSELDAHIIYKAVMHETPSILAIQNGEPESNFQPEIKEERKILTDNDKELPQEYLTRCWQALTLNQSNWKHCYFHAYKAIVNEVIELLENECLKYSPYPQKQTPTEENNNNSKKSK